MKILVSAHACSRGGSEGYNGWSAVQCLAKDHELWVLTSARNQSDLETATSEGLVPRNVHFTFLGGPFKPWSENRWIARFQSWKGYYGFSAESLAAAKDLHGRIRFDLAHHVTVATWRVGSPLWKLGIPFIFGPIGGNEKFPFRLFSILSFKAKVFELLRKISNFTSRLSPSVRACIRNASHVFTANFETDSLVKQIRGSHNGISRVMQSFHSEARIKNFARHIDLKTLDGPLRIFAGGGLEGRKGVALAIHALATVKKRGVRFRYTIASQGPELAYLRNLVQRLGLRDEVIFEKPFSGDAYLRELGATHVYLLPSLREGAPLTLMEAMLAGCVPIVANCGGSAPIVSDECGYRIPVLSREEIIAQIAETLFTIDRNRHIIPEKGRAARERISSHFTEENYRKSVNEIYARLVSCGAKATHS